MLISPHSDQTCNLNLISTMLYLPELISPDNPPSFFFPFLKKHLPKLQNLKYNTMIRYNFEVLVHSNPKAIQTDNGAAVNMGGLK